MTKQSQVFVLGATGYIGSNLLRQAVLSNMHLQPIDLRSPSVTDISLPPNAIVIDLSMPKTFGLDSDSSELKTFMISYLNFLSKVKAANGHIIRIGSAFDIVDFYRKDSYTFVSKKISQSLLNLEANNPRVTICYVHACYGGIASTSFIDRLIKSFKDNNNLRMTETLREYIHVEKLVNWLLSMTLDPSQLPVEIEIGAGKAYLTSDIANYVYGVSKNLVPKVPDKRIHQSMMADRKICVSRMYQSHRIEFIELADSLPDYLQKSMIN